MIREFYFQVNGVYLMLLCPKCRTGLVIDIWNSNIPNGEFGYCRIHIWVCGIPIPKIES